MYITYSSKDDWLFFTGNSDPENFQRCVNTINNSLQPLFLEIRQGVSEDDGKKYYGLVC